MPTPAPRLRPELLAPAGNWECARAAAANGADAVFFGLPRFNARLRADNFTLEELPAAVEWLHARGLRAYVTMNTLVFPSELADAEQFLLALQAARVDAIIVQDLGLVELARAVAPDVEIHASTQMTITSPEGARFASTLGVTRVVLAREISMRDMARFQDEANEGLPPLEVFVHGALCVAYSGQCLTSESLGQRSANRGECAQACRLPYGLVVDGAVKELGDKAYLLSPQDLAAVAEVPKLIELGVASFKIEGRLKAPEYVAAVCQVYRKAIDAALEHREEAVTEADYRKLELTFSRGLFSGWMHGVNHQQLVHARYSNKRGPLVAHVRKTRPDGSVEVEWTGEPLRPGDGLLFDSGGDQNRQQGGRIWTAAGARGNHLAFEQGRIDTARLRPGDAVYQTDDPRLDAALQKTFARDPEPKRERRSVSFAVSGRAGEPLRLEATLDGTPAKVVLLSAVPLDTARNRPLTEAGLRDPLGRLGETPFVLGAVHSALEGETILPVSELNRLRREAVAALEKAAEGKAKPAAPAPGVPALRRLLPPVPGKADPAPATLSVLCRTLDQIAALLASDQAPRIYADFEDIRRYKEAVALVREAQENSSQAEIWLATPRIQKAAEQGFFKLIENAAPDGVLIRNLGALDYFKTSPLRKCGDFSLNVANALTAQILMRPESGLGLETVAISYDLNARQVEDLLRSAPPAWFEIVLHQHMPMFHMEHCVFAAFLSEGKDHTDCGRPCDRHRVALKDRVGMVHPVVADVGCRNTVFHGRAQSGAAYVAPFRAAGAGRFRLELLHEDGPSARRIYETYRRLLDGGTTASSLIAELRVADQLGVTSGTLTVLG
ncbi:putative protease [Verrucomicrobium sp. GAS474]|uniref:peptidase U32 family protein n=1 Tax=Verrucomicrobium sp. GAS474 TaxID=1882831 RepID=UPI00087A8218|nr:U32 family peptidase [Verrucomicrobium sp. GAS474]SDT91431.1 putative protease [Verrucomicrobium sp. GAS474]